MTKICEDKRRNLFNKCFALDYTLVFILNTTEIKNNNRLQLPGSKRFPIMLTSMHQKRGLQR